MLATNTLLICCYHTTQNTLSRTSIIDHVINDVPFISHVYGWGLLELMHLIVMATVWQYQITIGVCGVCVCVCVCWWRYVGDVCVYVCVLVKVCGWCMCLLCIYVCRVDMSARACVSVVYLKVVDIVKILVWALWESIAFVYVGVKVKCWMWCLCVYIYMYARAGVYLWERMYVCACVCRYVSMCVRVGVLFCMYVGKFVLSFSFEGHWV